MLSAGLLLALLQDVTNVASVSEVRFGHLRHVQLLEPRDGEVCFATQVELGVMVRDSPKGTDSAVCVYGGSPLAQGEAQDPVAELALGTSMLRPFTWTNRPTWFLFELDGATRLAAVEPRRNLLDGEAGKGSLRLLGFPSGEVLLAVAGVQEIEDALVRGGRGELLARQGKHLFWVRVAEDEVVVRGVLDPQLDSVSAATFARGDASLEPRGWCMGLRGESLTLVPFSAAGTHTEDAFEIELEPRGEEEGIGPKTSLRLAAWATPSTVHVAIAWPSYYGGVGRLVVLDLSGGKTAELWRGRPDPEARGDMLDQRDYGQALAFVPDADGDGAPDLLVCGPWAFLDDTRVDLLSCRTGSAIQRWSSGHSSSVGHWLSVSADGTRALVGGTEFRGYPEDWRYSGHAHLLEVPSLKPLVSWVMEPQEP